MLYSHDQFGTLVVVAIGPFAVFMSIVLALAGLAVAVVSVFVVAVALVVLFYRLRVEVTSEYLSFAFGIGLIRRKFALADVAGATPVRNKWYYGWGIRYTPKGWLYNVSGFDAVEIQLHSGKRFRIGTDEPEALSAAVNGALEA